MPCRAVNGRALRLRVVAAGLRLGELAHVAQPAVEDRLDGRIDLAGLLGLVRHHRGLHEAPHQALERVVRALELRRVVDRPGRARLAAQPAVHALAHVDVEAGHDEPAGGLVLRGLDHDAVDRAGALAGEARGADLEVHLEHAPVAERERVLYADALGQAVGVLDSVGLADHVRGGHREPVGDGDDRVLDVAEVGAESHVAHHGTRAVDSGLKLRCRRVSRALRTWKRTRQRNASASTATSATSAARTAGTPAGKTTIHAAVPRRFTKASGTRYFQHMVIIWSTRMRGSVQRSQIGNSTPTV